MKFERHLKQRVFSFFAVVVVAFATGFLLQESEFLGPSPSLPGKVPLDAVANGNTDAAFTSSTHGASSLSGVIILER